MIKLRKFELSAHTAHDGILTRPLEFPGANPIVVLGGNGSGKTLFVRILQCLLSGGNESAEIWSSAFKSAQLDFNMGQESYIIEVDFASGVREMRRSNGYEPADMELISGEGREAEHDILPFLPDSLNAVLMTKTFLVIDGNIGVQFDSALMNAVTEIALERLIAKRERLRKEFDHLIAAQDEDGSLLKAQEKLIRAEEQRTHFIQAQQVIEKNTAERQSLEAQIQQLTEKYNLLQKESELRTRRRGIEQQVEVLRNWLDEVAHERTAVEKLRAQHVDLLNHFEESYRPFRGVPESFGEQLSEMADLQEKQQALSVQVESLSEERSRKQSDLATILEKRNHLEEEEKQSQTLSAGASGGKSEEIKQRLQTLHEVHLELQQERETKSRLLEEELGDSSMYEANLHEKSQRLLELHQERQRLLDQRKEREKRWLKLQEEERLQSRNCRLEFPDFDNLPPSSEDRLRKLFQIRDNLKDTESRMVEARRHLAEFHRHPHLFAVTSFALIVALLGFSAGFLLVDWALALFCALLISGFFLIAVGKHIAFPRRIKRRLDTELETLKAQWKEVLDAKGELEFGLEPLSGYPNLTSALKALHDYEAHKGKLQAIQNELAGCEEETANAPSINDVETEITTITESLPQKLRALEPEHLIHEVDDCARLHGELQLAKTRLKEYESEGEKALEIERLEAELHEAEALETDRQQKQQRREKEIRELLQLEKELKADLEEDALSPLLREKDELEQKLRELQRTWLAPFETQNPVILWEQWHQMADLRAELRIVRDRLSTLRTLDELQSREQVLKAELEPLQIELAETAHNLYASIDSEDLGKEMNHCKVEVQRMEQERNAMPLSLEELGFADVSLEFLSAEMEECRQRVHEMERRREELESAVAQMDEEIIARRESLPEEIFSAAANLLEQLTAGKIREVLWRSDGPLEVREAAGRTLPIESLSGGLKDLVMFALRLAMIEKMEYLAPPLVLDDPFSRLDPEHLVRVRETLANFSENHQVILLTRDPRYGAWGHTISLEGSTSDEVGTFAQT